jgi:hypothetical protein
MTLAYAGSRLSEVLALTAGRVDLAAGVLMLETLEALHLAHVPSIRKRTL